MFSSIGHLSYTSDMAIETKKTVMYYVYRLLAIMGPVLVTSYFTYRSAKYETEVGYETMVKAVDALQKVSKDQATAISELNGEVKVLQDMLSGHMNKPRPAKPAEATLMGLPPVAPESRLPDKDADGIAAEVTQKLRPLPRSLEAAKMMKAAE